ncbi:unnamed protein product [Linum tenue]|uniref:Pseudouridine synthase I TruA alpha/beta domain-containing protein n=1 Tax=Linum tenue TaxID=586396 RepID=A0AAV0NBD8_9ROSI|nr:unnamed protein product [Linum tenue]
MIESFAFRLCWERFGWNVQKSQELLLPVLKEYNKRETQLRLEAFYTFNERFAKIRSKRIKKAVKGITGKSSSTVLDDVPEEAPELTKKRRATPAESELKSAEGSILSSDHNLSGKSTTKRSKKASTTAKDISSEKEESGQELLSGNRQQTAEGSNKGGRGRGSGGRKGKGIGSGRGRGRRSRGLEPSGQSSGDTESSSEEHEDQIQNSKRPNEVRRSKRLRHPVSYTSDLEMDDVINSVDPDGKEEAAGEAKAHPGNADSSPAVREPQILEDDLLVQMDTTPREDLETGGGFCMDEGEAGNPEGGISINPSESNASKDYLESGGGFCVDESDAHNNQADVVSLSPPLEEDSTEKPRHGGLMNEVKFAAFSSLNAVNESAADKDPRTETLRTTETDDHLQSGSSSIPDSIVDDTLAPEAGGGLGDSLQVSIAPPPGSLHHNLLKTRSLQPGLHAATPATAIPDHSLINGLPLKIDCGRVVDADATVSTGFKDWKKWRLVVSYDGTRYAGWQFQESPPTIQGLLEKALTRATKLERKHLQVVGASRTDAGVHALGQVAQFLTPFNYDSLDRVHAALNGLLPEDIRVREVAPALPEFHARFSVTSKLYRYRIYNDAVMDPLLRHYAHHSHYKLDTAVMAEAATHFGPLIQLDVEGTGFLYRQVRNMVALLLQIGKQAIPPDIVPVILVSRDRRELAKYALAAPPHGLCLVSVNYNQDHLQLPKLRSPAVSFGRHHTISRCKLPPSLL